MHVCMWFKLEFETCFERYVYVYLCTWFFGQYNYHFSPFFFLFRTLLCPLSTLHIIHCYINDSLFIHTHLQTQSKLIITNVMLWMHAQENSHFKCLLQLYIWLKWNLFINFLLSGFVSHDFRSPRSSAHFRFDSSQCIDERTRKWSLVESSAMTTHSITVPCFNFSNAICCFFSANHAFHQLIYFIVGFQCIETNDAFGVVIASR